VFSELDDGYIGDFNAMSQMEIMKVFAESEEGQDSSIGEGDTFVQNDIAESGGLAYD
jgi:hypothetical protein